MITPFSDRTERCLGAIERGNRSFNALITVTPDQARATAAALDAQIAAGVRLGAAAGLVISHFRVEHVGYPPAELATRFEVSAPTVQQIFRRRTVEACA